MSMDIVLIGYVNATHGHHLPAHRRFQWETEIMRLSGGARQSQRNQLLEQPIRHWFINWKGLLLAEQQRFIEVFNRAKGQYDTFLLYDTDPAGDYQCLVTDWSYTAAGGETTTQLQKTYHVGTSEAWSEDKKDIVPGTIYVPTIKINGTAKTEGTHFTLSDTTGIINWAAGTSPNGALTAGQVITADYRFYFRVRFMMDAYDDVRDAPTLWQALDIHLMEDR